MKHTQVNKNYAFPFCTIFLFIFLFVASFSAVNVKAQGTGFLEICTGASGPGLEDRIFQYQIGAQIYQVPTGTCSGPIELPAGPNTVTELSGGNLIQGGTFSGRFRLLSVSTTGGPEVITAVNLENRTAVVNIAEGTVANSSIIRFTNTFAVSVVVEICKQQLTGASGVFNFTIDALPNQIIPVPAGFCSGPILVNVPTAPVAVPATAVVKVTKLARFGYYVTGANASPGGRFINFIANQGINNSNPDCINTADPVAAGCIIPNQGGGYATVNVQEGNAANETIVNFTSAFGSGPTGVLQICKTVTGTGLENRIFQYRIGGVPYEVSLPVGGCTGPLSVNAGPVTVEELNTGSIFPSGTFSGGFRLTGVTASPEGALGAVDLSARTAVVNVAEGTIANQTVVVFNNAYAINAILEICNYASDRANVGEIFNFTVDALPNRTFPVPVGHCSGPIQVTVVTPTVRVTQIRKSGFILESASAIPADRFVNMVFGVGINNTSQACVSPPDPVPVGCLFPNAGGGFATINVEEGNAANATTVHFNNRANPAQLKICKFAGPGITLGDNFSFDVTGTSAATGQQVTRRINVPAGPANQGGFCDFVRDESGANERFVVGTNILIDELTPANVFTSSISSLLAGTLVAATSDPNTNPARVQMPDGSFTSVFPNADLSGGRIVVIASAEMNTIEYTNNLRTAPVITPSVNGVVGRNGFYITNVNVSWIVADSGSAISSTNGCGTTTITTDTAGTTLTCSATNGIGTSSQSVIIKRDTAAPVVSFGAPNIMPNAAGWYNDNVSFPYSVSDTVSGLSASTPSSGSVVLSGEGNAVSGSVTVTDNAGNTAIVNSPVVRIDKTAPTLANLNNIRINSGAPSTATYNVTATDTLTLSPVVVCNPASGSTFPVGITTVICTATDLAGNQSAGSFNVAVYTNEQQPVPTGSNVTVEPETGLPETGLTLTFNQVDVTGVTTVEPIADPATVGEVPGGFSISNTIAYQIETTAQFTGPVVLAFQVPFSDADNDGVDDETGTAFADLRILHREQTGVDADNQPVFGLVDRTILPPDSPAPNLATRTIYARTTSFSPFYLAQKVNHQIVPLFDQSKPMKSGSTIPLKIKLLNAAGTVNLSAPGTILTVRGVTSLDDGMFAADSPGNSNPENVFDFKTGDGGHYQYNLKTTGLAPGRYVLSFYVGSNLSYFYTVRFDIK